MEADPDQALIERCRRDEGSALKELVERYQDAVYGPIARAVPEQARAEQLAQEVFVRIHRNLPYFRGEASVRSWILRTTSEVCPAASEATGRSGTAAAFGVSTPPQFASRTIARIRRDGWQREQMLDVAFNVTIAVVALATVALAWYFIDASGLSGLFASSFGLVGSQAADMTRGLAPSVPAYAAAVVVLGGVLLAWWWAER